MKPQMRVLFLSTYMATSFDAASGALVRDHDIMFSLYCLFVDVHLFFLVL